MNYFIININGKIIEINEVKILGMEESFKYKVVHFPSFTQEESIVFLENQPQVDMLIFHDRKYDYMKKRILLIKDLLELQIIFNKILIYIHRHIHENYYREMINGTINIAFLVLKLLKL